LTGEGSAALLAGRWREALEAHVEAERIFSQECVGAAWEVTTSRWFRLWARAYRGELRLLAQEVATWLRDGEARGDLRALVGNTTGLAALVWLADDRPDEARRVATEAMRRWSRAAFHVQHWWDLFGQSQIDLYTGDAARALDRVTSTWASLKGSMLLRVQLTRIEAVHLRARCALACCAAKPSDDLLAMVERDARAIAREQMSWATPLARLVRASAASLRGRADEAAPLLREATFGFDAEEMSLHAAAARSRLAAMRSGDEREELERKANAFFESEGVKNSERMIAMVAPGFTRTTS
jgi:hypothetical protein